ncbi:MAG TPA: molybdenum cofactor biosysynthesis protein [Sulfurovum sp. UBA12169]|nr:MAG TPA: molybdenum cofactor biosysynthesis protein [Sulfurovum sp. UBA12169]
MNGIAAVLSVQIGSVTKEGEENSKEFLTKTYETASYKLPVSCGVRVTKNGIEGDFVADTVHHGEVDKAVFANSFKNYESWKNFLGLDALAFGALAENLTFDAIDETDVCIGDVHKIGSVILEVSQPRKPCWKISRRWQNKHFTKEIYDTGKTGWYYRVIQEGMMAKGDKVELISRQNVLVSIQEANEAFKDPDEHPDTVEKLMQLDVLAPAWKRGLEKRVANKNEVLEYMKIDD